jgi:Mg-chelatase subunit ChlD
VAELDLLGLDTIWLAIPLAVAAAALAVWLYLPEARALRRRQGLTLLCVRAAVVVLMALILLQPVLRFVHTGRRKSTILFFVDTSESMSVADTGISPGRVEQLVEGLRLRDKVDDERSPEDLGARAAEVAKVVERLAAPGAEIGDWRAELDSARRPLGTLSTALGELDTARVAASDRAAVETVAFLNEELGGFKREEGESDSAAAGRLKWVAQDCLPAAKTLSEQTGWLERALGRRSREDAVSGEERARRLATESTRLELAVRALTSEKLSVIKEIAKSHDIRGFTLAGTARALDLVRDGKPVVSLRDDLKRVPSGKATDLAGGILAGVNEMAGASGKDLGPSGVAGVVVLSDGRQTSKGSPLGTAGALGARGIPVYAVGVGSAGEPRDAAVVRLSAPESVFKDDKISLEVAVRMSGIPEERVPVTLSERGRTIEIRNVDLENGAGRTTFEVPAEAPGLRRFTVSIPEFDSEATLGNNSRDAMVKVVEDKMHVTLVFEYPRWELRFVRNLIWRDRKMELDVVSFVEEEGKGELGRTREEIMKSSIFVLDDVAAGRFSPDDRKNLSDFVTRRGGTLIMIAGPEHLPADYTGPPLGDLLPFKSGGRPEWRVRGPGEEPFTLRLTAHGRAESFMGIADPTAGDEDPEAFWAGLPGFFEFVAAGKAAQDTKVLLEVAETGDPALTVRRHGLGKVMFLAMHETWRWRYKVADRDHGRFWGNVLRYAGEQPFAVKGKFVSLDADRSVYSPGESVNVRARVVDSGGLPVQVDDLVCVLERKAEEDARDGDDIRRVVKRPLEGALEGGGIYRAAFGAEEKLPGGDYVIRVESPGLGALHGGRPGDVTLEISVTPRTEDEFVDTSFSEETLAEMARASGGRYFDVSQIADLPDAVGKGWDERTTITRIELWSSHYVFALVLVLLSAEWVYRKRLGLA